MTPENEKKNNRFYSGIGSRHEEFMKFILTKSKFFTFAPSKPSVVDLDVVIFL